MAEAARRFARGDGYLHSPRMRISRSEATTRRVRCGTVRARAIGSYRDNWAFRPAFGWVTGGPTPSGPPASSPLVQMNVLVVVAADRARARIGAVLEVEVAVSGPRVAKDELLAVVHVDRRGR